MSTGFRIFLLMLFAFGAVYAYRLRSQQISSWLTAQPKSAPPGSPNDALISPVERVFGPEISLARLVGRPLADGTGKYTSRGAALDRETEESFPEGLPAEAQLEAADLPPEILSDSPVEEDPGYLVTNDPPSEGSLPRDESSWGEITYKVEEGDNLWKIASKELGSGARYGEIREWNPEVFRGKSTDTLQAGTILKIRVGKREENLKVSQPDADRSVEGRSPPGSEETGQRPSRSTVKKNGGRRRVASR